MKLCAVVVLSSRPSHGCCLSFAIRRWLIHKHFYSCVAKATPIEMIFHTVRYAMFTEIFRAQRREGIEGRDDWLPELISELLRTRTGGVGSLY